MSDTERPRDHNTRREPRGGRDRDNERPTHSERRNRSRSPRERGSRRDGGRYRSRSPLRRDNHDRESNRSDRGRGTSRDRPHNAPPRGPRSAPVPRAPPPTRAPAKASQPTPSSPSPPADIPMPDSSQRPEGRPSDMDDSTWEISQIMGFSGFKSTKNTKVPGNDKNYGVRKDKQMEARQYMNRQGGFNRPLSPSRG